MNYDASAECDVSDSNVVCKSVSNCTRFIVRQKRTIAGQKNGMKLVVSFNKTSADARSIRLQQ